MAARVSRYKPKLVKIPRSEIFKLSKKKISAKREELVKFYRNKLQEMNKKGIFEDRINLVRVQNMLRYAISKIDVKEIIRQSREELIRKKNEETKELEKFNVSDHSQSINKLFSKQRKKLRLLQNLVGKKNGSISQSFQSPATPREVPSIGKLPQIKLKRKMAKVTKLSKPPMNRRASKRKMNSLSSNSLGNFSRSSSRSTGSSRSRRSSKRGSSSSLEGKLETEDDLLFPLVTDPNVDYTLSSVLDRFIEYNIDNVSMPSFIRPRGKVSSLEHLEVKEKKKKREEMARNMVTDVDKDCIHVKEDGEDGEDEEDGEGTEDEPAEKNVVEGDDELVDQFRHTQIDPLKRTKFPSLLQKHFGKEWVEYNNVVEPDDPSLTEDERKIVEKDLSDNERIFRRKLLRHMFEQRKEIESDRYSIFRENTFDEEYVELPAVMSPKDKRYKEVMGSYQRDALEKKKDRLSRRYKEFVPQNTEFPRIKSKSFLQFVKEEEDRKERLTRLQRGLGEKEEKPGKGMVGKESELEERKKMLKEKARQHTQTLQLCQLLEKSITILCREFNDIMRTANKDNATEQPEVPTLRELLLMSLKLIPVSNSLRAKRSWIKGSEILFLWELNLDRPFSIADENHLRLLAVKYVNLYFDNDRILTMTEEMRDDISKGRKIVKGWEQEKTEFLETLVSRRGVMKGDPFEIAVKFLKDHKKLEDDVIREEEEKRRGGEYGWSRIKDVADADSSGIGTFVYRIFLNNKKFLYVINCYMNYCGLDTQRYFQILVDRIKTRKVNIGLPSPRVDIKEEGKDILKNHSFDDFLNFIIRTNQLVELRKDLEEQRKNLEMKRRLESRKGFNTHLSSIGDMMESFRDMVKEINKKVEEERKKYSLKKRNKRIDSTSTLGDDEHSPDLSMTPEMKFKLKNIRNITSTPLGHEVMRRSIMKKKEVDYYGEMHHLIQDEEEYLESTKEPSSIDIGGKSTNLEERIVQQDIQRDRKHNRLEYLKELMRQERSKRGPVKGDTEKFKPIDLSTPIPRAYSWVEIQSAFDDEKIPNETEEERKERRLIRAGLMKKKEKDRTFGSRSEEKEKDGSEKPNEVKVERRKKKNLQSMLDELRKAEEVKKKARELRRKKKLELMAKKIEELDKQLIAGQDVTKEIDDLQKKIENEMLNDFEDEKEGEEEEEGEEEVEWEDWEGEEEGEEEEDIPGVDKVKKPFSGRKKRKRKKRKRRVSREEKAMKKLIRQDTLRMEEIRKFFEQRKKGGRISQRNKKRVAELIKDVYDRSKTLKRLEQLEMEEEKLLEEQKKSKQVIEGVELFTGFKDTEKGNDISKPTKENSVRKRLHREHLEKLKNRKSDLDKLRETIEAEKSKLKKMMMDQEEKNKEKDSEYVREQNENKKIRKGLKTLMNTFLDTPKFDKENSREFINDVTIHLTRVGENEELADTTINLLKSIVGQQDKLKCKEGEMKDLSRLLNTMEKKRKVRLVRERELEKQVDAFSGADFVKDVAEELQGRDSEERELKNFLSSFVKKEEKKRKKRWKREGILITDDGEKPKKGSGKRKTKSGKKKTKGGKKKRKGRKGKVGVDEEEVEGEGEDEDEDEEVDGDILEFLGSEFMNEYSQNLKVRLKKVKAQKRREERLRLKKEKEEEKARRRGKGKGKGKGRYKSPKKLTLKQKKEEEMRKKGKKTEQEEVKWVGKDGFKLYDEETGIRRGSENWHLVVNKKGKVVNNSLEILQGLKNLWESLRYSAIEIINFEQKFNEPPYVTKLPLISQLFNMWRCAKDLVLRREKILEDMFEFEKKQVLKSDRKMKKRIETSIEKKRVFFFKLLTRVGMECEKIAIQLFDEHKVELKFKGMNYIEKMKNDYDAVLYAIEGRYLRASGFNHYEEVLEKIGGIIKDMKKKRDY